ncbi:hypothetical protein TWF788_007199 [Orbilia oligospora]|uniref:Uncharacterized protein n=1 Tax=Orbilia oligospora TaxID=2813651 RepID=A0A7C8U2U2_ORBOL|nr:hypothetical protein TWF788_007199 [Orbilia oligospora]
MTIFVQIRPPNTISGPNTQPCGTDRYCSVSGSKFTTGLCGTWLGQENHCCTVTDLGLPGAPYNNSCGTISGIHDSSFSSFGSGSVGAKSCPTGETSVSNAVGGDNEQCCPYQNYNRIDQDIAAVYFYQAIGEGSFSSNLTGIRCLNLTSQGRVDDDGSSSYSGTKSGGGGGSNSGDSGSGGSSSTGKPNGGGILTVPNFILGGILVAMGLAAQLQI